MKKHRFFLTLILLVLFANLGIAESPILEEGFVFDSPPTPSCHASTLTETPSGNVLCAWFGGSREGADDVAIYLASQEKGNWNFPHVIAKEKAPCWNPVLYTMPSGKILLFYKAGKNPREWSGILKTSPDEGRSWPQKTDLPAGVIGPAKNRPLLLEDGTLLCGSSAESWRRWGCWIDITSDDGTSWKKSTPINLSEQLFGIIQPAIVFANSNKLKLFARSHQVGYICSAESEDQGATWTTAKTTNLPNPNSSIDAINLKDGRILLVYNHSQRYRYPLNVAISKDGGNTWETTLSLETNPGEYSYPCAIQTADGKIHISYTWNRKNIKHVVLDPTRL